ncbi:MAG: lipase [Planctomycetota bacterium]|nr:MAG: lipase [Planctomycetota bacterium]
MESESDRVPKAFPNLPLPTLGGKQFWTDHCWQAGWRLQHNAVTGHWRVLDDHNVRRGWGNRAACEALIAAQAPRTELVDDHAVILLHGLMRSATSMKGLGDAITEAQIGTPICFEYASTRRSVADHASALRDVVRSLPDDARLSFVGHSLGNIVVRHAIADWQSTDDQLTLQRLERVVMLGPPNQGAGIARQLARTGLFEVVVGRSGMQLGPDWSDFARHLATPPCPFGIVAGNLSETIPQNPLVDSAGDLVVTVDETRLDGAADFLEVACLHSFLMDDPGVQEAVVHFLREGRFPRP